MNPSMSRSARPTQLGENHIKERLSRFPQAMPQISVYSGNFEPFEIEVRETPHCPVPLEVGAEGAYADYDVRRGLIQSAVFLQVARQVRIKRAWCFEVQEAGGAIVDGQATIDWSGPGCYCRVDTESIHGFDPLFTTELTRFPRRLGPTVEVSWSNDLASGPELGVAGFCTVAVAGRPFECIRVLQRHPVEPDDCQLDEIYLTAAGRVILLRKYSSTQPAHWNRPHPERNAPWQAPGIGCLTYNGVEHLHWFDRLTGLALL
jgi:hypothetical protein